MVNRSRKTHRLVNWEIDLWLFVTTSKAPVTSSVALVTNSFLLLLGFEML